MAKMKNGPSSTVQQGALSAHPVETGAIRAETGPRLASPRASSLRPSEGVLKEPRSERGDRPNPSEPMPSPSSKPPGVIARSLSNYEVLCAGWNAHDWKGDFQIPGLGAGHVRIGRQLGRQWDAENRPREVDQFIFLIDGNLIDRGAFEHGIRHARLTIGPRNFDSAQASSIELTLTAATQDGYVSYTRSGGSNWVHEKKYLAAAVETRMLRTLAGESGGVSFYGTLEMKDGRTLFINQDGRPEANFEVATTELLSQSG